MKQQWLNFILHFGGYISFQKQKLINASALATIPMALSILVLEVALFLCSLPAYIFISPIEFGGTDQKVVASYRLRRIVSLSVVLGTAGIWLLYIALTFLGISLFPKKIHAFTSTWDFNEPLAYSYDSSKIQVVDGMVVFHAQQSSSQTDPLIETNTSVTATTTIETPTVEPTPTISADTSAGASTDDSSVSAPTIETAPEPTVVEPTPAPAPEPAPTPEPAPAPAPEPASLLYDFLKNNFSIASVHAQTLTCEATIQPLIPFVVVPLDRWSGFTEVANKNGGEIYYQLSFDAGLTWQYWNGSAWTVAGPTNFNTAAEINSHISSFSTLTGSILFKGKMVSDCQHEMQLLTVAIDYEKPNTGFSLTSVDPAVTFSDSAGNTLVNTTNTVYINYLGEPAANVRLSGDLDLTNQIVGSAIGSSWVSLAGPALSSIDNLQLIIPKTNSNAEVIVCPGALAAVNILPGCLNEVRLTSNQSSASGYSLVRLDDPSHWYIEVSTTGTLALGATEVAQQALPVNTETITSCGTILNTNNISTLSSQVLPSNDYVFSGQVTFDETGKAEIIVRRENSSNQWRLSFADGTVQFTGLINGLPTVATNANIADFAPQANQNYNFKIQVHGEQLRAKWWLSSSAEPDSWLLYAADNRILSGGVGVDTSSITGAAGATFSALSISTCLENETVAQPEIVVPALLAPANDLSVVIVVEPTATTTPAVQVNASSTVSAPAVSASEIEIVAAPGTITVIQDEQTNLIEVVVGGLNGVSTTLATSLPLDTTQAHVVVVTVGSEETNLYVDGAIVDTVSSIALPSTTIEVVNHIIDAVVQEIVPEVLTPVEVVVDYLEHNNHAPVITISSAAQQSNDGFVDVRYIIKDEESNYVSLSKYEYSLTGNFTGEEKDLTLALADLDNQGANALSSSPTGVGHILVWNARADLGNTLHTRVYIRLKPTDGIAPGTAVISAPLAVDLRVAETDTQAPFGLANFQGSAANTTQIQWSWSPIVSEDHFARYEIWYGIDENGVRTHSTTSAKLWNVSSDNDMAIMGTNKTIITGLRASTTYYAQITAYDSFGNNSVLPIAIYSTLANSTLSYGDASTPAVPVVGAGSNVISYGAGSGGNSVSVILPTDATKTPQKPKGGFDITINNDDKSTDSADVNLSLRAGADVTMMALSNFADMHDAQQEPYNAGKKWNLCSEQGGLKAMAECLAGKHSVYARFYTAWGESTKTISDDIILTKEDVANIIVTNGSAASPQISVSSGGGGNNSAAVEAQNFATDNPKNPEVKIAISQETQTLLKALNETKESPILLPPTVSAVSQNIVKNGIELAGKSIPNAKVALFLHSDQVVVYTTQADMKGDWNFTHDQSVTTLSPGEHTIYAVTYDEGSGVKSKPTPLKSFIVKENKMGRFFSYFDIWTTVLTLLVSAVLMIIIIFSRKQNKITY